MSQLLGTPPPARPMRADARRNREAVMAAARVVFAEAGREAQMDDVASRAGVGVGTVYRHFPTKEALFAALAQASFEQFAAIGREALAMDDPWEGFAHVIQNAATLLAADRALSQVVMETPAAMEAAAGIHAELAEILQEVIRRAQEAGALRADLVADDIGMLMCGVGNATRKSHQCPDAWRRHIAILLDGLRADAATGALPT